MKSHAIAALAAVLCIVQSRAYSQDPPAPAGGFGFVVTSNLPVVWADGYNTLMDIYEPDSSAPATGWPGVLIVHGGGGSKNVLSVTSKAKFLASYGYVCYAYDVRGDGSTTALNPGWPPFHPPEEILHDSAESHTIAQGLAPGKIDPTRLGVSGFSQGGQHSIEAAAWSGKIIPCPIAGCTITTYPTVLAVAPEGQSLNWIEKNMPGGVIVNGETIDDMGPTNPFLLLLNANDYVGALAWLQGQYSSTILTELQTSTVPMHIANACQDAKHLPNSMVDGFNVLPPGTPRRMVLTTGGHASPVNDHEDIVLLDMQRRWFDRFMKGILNGSDLEKTVEVAVQPDTPVSTTPTSIWEHRDADVWPPPVTLTLFHFRGNGSLTQAPPPAVEAGPVIVHTVAAGYDAVTYVQQNGYTNPAVAFASIPKVTFPFETGPLPQQMEVFGRVHVVLHVNDTTGVCQVSAELSHVAPGGAIQRITIGAGGVRAGVAGAHQLEFDLGDIAYVVPAGHRIRVSLMNIAHHQAPTYQRIRFVPYFTNTTTTLDIAPGTPSRVEIPLREYVINMAPRLGTASSTAGISHDLRVSGGAGRAGWIYAILLGASGEAPGTTFPGVPTIPLVVDSLTLDGANAANGPFLPNFVGALDAQGYGLASVMVPAGLFPQLVGMRLTFAGVVLNPAGPIEAFGPTTLEVLP
ncbi:MAG: CocE/NonD family hydrolase C-terminal non-catalytic domain-containing protein [Planctomycetota bacterium]